MVTLEISEHWRVVSGDVDNERPLDRIFSVGTRHGEGILTGLVIGQRGLGLDVQSIGSLNRQYIRKYILTGQGMMMKLSIPCFCCGLNLKYH